MSPGKTQWWPLIMAVSLQPDARIGTDIITIILIASLSDIIFAVIICKIKILTMIVCLFDTIFIIISY